MYPKISIITVCYNSENFIQQTIESVLAQTYNNIEYIIIDGGSIDNTKVIIDSFGDKINCSISEPDNGIYDAMNKGIAASTGDYVGILNSDDFFFNNFVIENLAKEIIKKESDIYYGDINFISDASPDKIHRLYSGKYFSPWMFRFGLMPAHPSVYIKTILLKENNCYRTDFKIASDFELLVRLFINKKVSFQYLNYCLVNMRLGGASTKSFKSKNLINKETVRALKDNGIWTNWLFIYLKYFIKLVIRG